MRFKTDENVHPDAAGLLRERGHDALTVWDQDLRGTADRSLLNLCLVEGRILITLDLDFADIRSFPPTQGRGTIILRPFQENRAAVLKLIDHLLGLLERENPTGALWIVDEHSVRIRSGEDA